MVICVKKNKDAKHYVSTEIPLLLCRSRVGDEVNVLVNLPIFFSVPPCENTIPINLNHL